VREKEEEKELLEEMIEFSKENPIIVEGIKDKRALRNVGIRSMHYNNGVEEFCEKIRNKYKESKRVLILTDYDRRGEILRKQIKEALSRYGMEENIMLRLKFKRITKLSHVEGFRMG
jgi:5S rRNA maturation endonuclease (ribonuclease M5)